jgi:hypothetical protein
MSVQNSGTSKNSSMLKRWSPPSERRFFGMDGSTTAKLTRVEQCQANAKKRSEQKRQAGVSLVFLRSHPDLVQAIEEAARTRVGTVSPALPGSSAKDQVIAALRRRLDEMKQQLAAKDRELCGKQREIDRLYGKLAAASPLTDAELRQTLQEVLHRLASVEEEATKRTRATEQGG